MSTIVRSYAYLPLLVSGLDHCMLTPQKAYVLLNIKKNKRNKLLNIALQYNITKTVSAIGITILIYHTARA